MYGVRRETQRTSCRNLRLYALSCFSCCTADSLDRNATMVSASAWSCFSFATTYMVAHDVIEAVRKT